jgi:hypothetical protein
LKAQPLQELRPPQRVHPEVWSLSHLLSGTGAKGRTPWGLEIIVVEGR